MGEVTGVLDKSIHTKLIAMLNEIEK